MNTNILIGLVVVAVLAAGGFGLMQKNNAEKLQMEQKAMEEKKMMEEKAAIENGAMMEAEGSMMMKEEGDWTKEEMEAMEKDGAMMDHGAMMVAGEESMASKGTYEKYAENKLALADEGNVVLFFKASWCPTCRSVDADIRSHIDAIPGGLTILDVDYDNSAALKQKYGVTYQHTFVQVDSKGNMIAKWTGSPTLAALISEVK